MAITVINSANSLAAKLWSKQLMREALAKTYFRKFMGTSQGDIVQILTDTQKRRGDRITFGLRMLLTGQGVTGQNTLKGNLEALTFYSDSIMIDLMRHGVAVDTTISQQRTEYDLRKEARDALSDWWADRFDTYMINYLSGDTTMNFAGNVGTAPDSDHILYGGSATSKATLTADDKFDLSVLEKAVVKAETLSPAIRPVNIEGEQFYVVLLHPYQARDLRMNTSTGQWQDIQKAVLMGGRIKDNPLFTGALGVYNGCILYKSNRIKTYNDYGSGGNVAAARALFLGAQAGVVAFGSENGVDRMTWHEEMEDHGKDLEVSASCIWGVKKTTFNGKDFGVIAIDTAAAP